MKLFFILLLSCQTSVLAVSESDLKAARDAFQDGFFEVTRQKLSDLIYEPRADTPLKQEGLLLLAFALLQDNDPKKAENLLDRLFVEEPLFLEIGDVCLLKLKILLQKGDFYLAEKTLDLLWTLDLTEAQKQTALDCLMKKYFEKSQYVLAHEFLNEKILGEKNEGDRVRFQLALMECLLLAGKLPEAGTLIRESTLSQATPEVRERVDLLTGRMLLEGRDYSEGIRKYLKLFESASASRSARQEALFGLCLSHWNRGEYDKAKEYLDRYLESYPLAKNAPVAELMRAQACLKQKRYGEAEKKLRELTEKPLDEETYYKSLYWLGEVCFRQKKYDEAVLTYQKLNALKTLDPLNEVSAEFGLAWVDYDRGRVEQARQRFEWVSQMKHAHPFVQEAALLTADCRYLLKEYPEAETAYRAFIERNPRHPKADEARFKLGLTQSKEGQDAKAVETWDSLASLFPHSERAEEGLWKSGQLLQAKGRFETASEKYRQLNAAFPGGVFQDFAVMERANCEYSLGRYPEALAIYQSISETSKNPEWRHRAVYFMGWCHFLLKEADQTVALFTEFLKQAPQSTLAPQVRFWLGEFEYHRKNYQEALVYFEALIQAHADSDLLDNAYYLASKSAYFLEDFQKTIALLSKFIQKLPQSDLVPDAYFLMGEASSKAGLKDEALDCFLRFETAFETSYLRKEAFSRLGDLFWDQKNFKNADLYFEKANRQTLGESFKDDATLVLKRALCQKEMGHSEKALELALSLIYDVGDQSFQKPAADFCVRIYEEKKEYAKAIKLLHKLLPESRGKDGEELKYRIRKLEYLSARSTPDPAQSTKE